jgi:hypothetical protein
MIAALRAPMMHPLLAVAVVVASVSSSFAQQGEWLSRGSKAWAPTVTKTSGIGTANAVAEAKATKQEIQGWCENWSPEDKGCVAREMASPDFKATYRATADCLAGKITTIDGQSYALAGVWDASDIGGGRTKWKDASGAIVGRDNASGGLGIAQQWETLCPGPLKAKAGGAKPAPPQAAAGAFAVGEIVEAKYGRDWVRGRIDEIRPGPSGPEYDVRLDNGQRGILPPRMVRKAQ